MPFVCREQLSACYARHAADRKMGRKPKWDCSKWYHDAGGRKAYEALPHCHGSKKHSRKKTSRELKRASRKSKK